MALQGRMSPMGLTTNLFISHAETYHSDTQVDATTGTRHHPGDYLTRELMGLLTVLFFGIPVAYWSFYRICSITL